MRFVGTALVAGTIGVFFLLAQGGWTLAGTGRTAEVEKATPRTGDKVLFGYSHFREFRDMKVENVDGQKLGTINDLIMEGHSGRPAYVIVSSSGWHRRFVIVPASAIAFRTAKVGIAAIDVTKQQWRRAPEFLRKDMASLGQPERTRQISQFYKLAENAPGTLTATDRQKTGLSSTGRAEQAISPSQHRGQLANDLIGSEVIARQQMSIGKISDLLVDFSETKPTFAIVSTERPFGTRARYAVPVRVLRLLPGGTVAVNADRQKFAQANTFRESDLQNSAWSESEEIYRYER